MSASSLTAWHVSESDFPQQGTPAEQLQFLLKYAVLAPSGHNTQPWLFKLQPDRLELYADRARALPVVDPQDRALIISCGAALFNLRVAMQHFGHTAVVEVLPDPHHPDLLARVRLGPVSRPNAEDEALFEAIPKRHTHRLPFQDRPIPDALLTALQAAAIAEQSWLVLIQSPEQRQAIANLIAEGDRRQMADPQFRRELSAWIHPNRSQHCDGMPGYAHGFGDWLSYGGSWVIRHFNLCNTQAQKDQQLAIQAPVLAVFGTEHDTPKDWLCTGQALASVLLRARANGVWAAFMNQPIEVSDLRPQLRQLLQQSGYPQLLLRLGFGTDIKPTPRRPVQEVLIQPTSTEQPHSVYMG